MFFFNFSKSRFFRNPVEYSFNTTTIITNFYHNVCYLKSLFCKLTIYMFQLLFLPILQTLLKISLFIFSSEGL